MSVTFYVLRGNEILQQIVETPYGEENLLSLNVSNRNAVLLLDTLGFPIDRHEMCGQISDLEQFKRTCESTLALLRANPKFDEGREAEVSTGANGCTMVDCALADGYLADRIDSLLHLAEVASQNEAVLYYS